METCHEQQVAVIRSWESMSNEYGVVESGGWIIPDEERYRFLAKMKGLCGKAIEPGCILPGSKTPTLFKITLEGAIWYIVPYMTVGCKMFDASIEEGS